MLFFPSNNRAAPPAAGGSQTQSRSPAQGQAQNQEALGARPAKGPVGAESRLPNRTPPRGEENPPAMVPPNHRDRTRPPHMSVPQIGMILFHKLNTFSTKKAKIITCIVKFPRNKLM